ncbi:hypothetical protein PWT90_04531 [Aphanocladium album]|nr:hypothetical protein PWT90_04531 [Aphanocladium album]
MKPRPAATESSDKGGGPKKLLRHIYLDHPAKPLSSSVQNPAGLYLSQAHNELNGGYFAFSDPTFSDLRASFGLVESIAGLSAGTIATLVVHPLDIVKTRMQIYRSVSDPLSKPPTTVRLLRSLTSNPRPIASLYRGLTPNLVGNATSWASFFFFKSRFERLLAQRHGGTTDAAARPSAGDYFVASALAGAATSVLTNPVWVLKTRMLSSDHGAQGAYPSMTAGARIILRTEGLVGFYRGLVPGVVRVMPATWVTFLVYENVRFYLPHWVADWT